MKRSVTSWNRFLKMGPDGRSVFGALLVLAPLLMGSNMALAADGRLTFSGQVSNASCAVLQSTELAAGQSVREVKVTAVHSIVVDASRNACANQNMPFTAQYKPLTTDSSAVNASGSKPPQSGAGILILTYQ
jgi:type 1 fimbria pilin